MTGSVGGSYRLPTGPRPAAWRRRPDGWVGFMPRLLAGWSRDAMLRATLSAVAVSVLVIGSVIVSTTPAPAWPGQPALGRLAARTHWLAAATSVLAGAPDQVAEGVAGRLLAAAPVVVVSRPDRPASLEA